MTVCDGWMGETMKAACDPKTKLQYKAAGLEPPCGKGSTTVNIFKAGLRFKKKRRAGRVHTSGVGELR